MGSNSGSSSLPHRQLGKTARQVSLFGLGGEGVLRTFGRDKEAAAVIQRALERGVTYFDTAPAYSGSMDYLGANLGEHRKDIFLACKTHDRSRDGSLRLLEESLARLRTDYFDSWQLHDLRSIQDLNVIFGPGGAMEALLEAKEQGIVKHLGITGHHDPEILLEAMRRFSFDTVLVALNVADVHRLSFIHSVLPDAKKQNVGVIGMKVLAGGILPRANLIANSDAIDYVLSLPGVCHAIIGCSTPEEVDENAEAVRRFQTLGDDAMREMEERSKAYSPYFCSYKK